MRAENKIEHLLRTPYLFYSFQKSVLSLFTEDCRASRAGKKCQHALDCFFRHGTGETENQRQQQVRKKCEGVLQEVLAKYKEQANFQPSDEKEFKYIAEVFKNNPKGLESKIDTLFQQEFGQLRGCDSGQACPNSHFNSRREAELIRQHAVRAEYEKILSQVKQAAKEGRLSPKSQETANRVVGLALGLALAAQPEGSVTDAI